MKVGLDFGTTNSSIARVTETGKVELAHFPFSGGLTESFRSLLYLERLKTAGRTTLKSWAGPEAIERYLDADDKGRLIQSLKSFLTSRSLQTTEIFGRRFQLEELVANVIREIRLAAEKQFGGTIDQAVVGRPVRFVGAESAADDEFALSRLRVALEKAGFAAVEFEFEPVAAAYYYESTLDHDEQILIGDFGGGTSDFSLLAVGPSARRMRHSGRAVLGSEGLGLAGDAFDAKIIRHLVSPALGAGSLLNSQGKLLPVPGWVYFKLERWHHLSFLRSRETLNMLQSVATLAQDRAKIQALLYLVQHDLGFYLHRAVQKTKVSLSEHATARFEFQDGDVEIDEHVSRAHFEQWIADELAGVEEKVDALLRNTGIHPKDVDRVFLTGGSSFVPAIRRIFESRFGTDKIRTGDEFSSVARGLALRAASA